MTRHIIALTIFFLPGTLSAQTRILLNADISRFSVGNQNYEETFLYYSGLIEVEHEFENKWFPDFAVGISKEGRGVYNGTYINARLFHAFDLNKLSMIISGGAIYGLAGLQFDRTQLIYQDEDIVGYHNVSMNRNTHVPGTSIKTAGILQPLIDARVRKYFGQFLVEGRTSFRFAKFKTVSSDFRGNFEYSESIVPMPSFGIGIGFTF